MKKLLAAICVALLMVGCGLAISAKEPVRTWTDIKGATIKAGFVQFSNDKVIIRREDGVSFNVSPAIFSEKDRKYLDELSQKLNLTEEVEPVHKNLGPTGSNSNESKPTATKLIPTVTHKTVAGTGREEGMAVYKPMVVVEREKAEELVSGNESIEGAIIQFFASLMRGDKDFEAILSPTIKASIREQFITEMPMATKGLNQVSIQWHLPFEQAAQHRVLGKMATAGREIFGDFDSMVFCEGNTNRDDIPMLLVQYEGKWYVAGIFARQFKTLLPPKFRD